MNRFLRTSLFVTAGFALATTFCLLARADGPAAPKGLGDPGALKGIKVEPSVDNHGMTLRGRDARQQIYVTGVYESGQFRDLTRQVQFKVEPEGVLSIDAAGLVHPIKDGPAKLVASGPNGLLAELAVTVEGIDRQIPINFKNQIVPIFTKLGCNSGGCHGKASGQNGFKLSLLGFYPTDDHEFLVKEGRGRRLFPSSPSDSLLLQKATGQTPHGGGKRMEVDSYEYRMLARWIEQGMPYGRETDPVVTGIKCLPEGRTMDRRSQQQITVLASYSDGSTEDVTQMALYEPNDTEMAEASKSALVQTLDLSGEVAIMARYQGQVSTFRATIPLGAPIASLPEKRNFIDNAVFSKLTVLGIPPSPVSDDGTFMRRVSVDITGTLPTAAEVEQFIADKDPAKRDRLIDRLVDTTSYADYFTNKWNMILRNKKRAGEDTAGTFEFYQWIWSCLYDNKPYDRFVSEILTASGERSFNPPVVWYREVDEPNEQVEDTAQLFLGLRIQCARCHHHPFEKWSQDDYYSLAAFFSRVGKKELPPTMGSAPTARDKRVFHNEGLATSTNPRSNVVLKPAGLGGKSLDIPVDRDPRRFLADWMADKSNPFFAKSLVNRYWKHFFSRGIVEPEDDMRETNPPANPELLNQLAQHFVDSGFDLKQLVKTICKSSTYQLSSLPNDYNLKDKQNFSRYYPKRLSAEVLYDGLHQVTASSENYSGVPVGTRATQLPDPSIGPYFLKVFGQPQGDTACECERSQEANLAQSLHLLNSTEVQTKISSPTGRAAALANDAKRPNEEKMQELYRWVYSRAPNADEMKIAMAHIARCQERGVAAKQKPEEAAKTAYEDIVWALINTKEFLFNH